MIPSRHVVISATGARSAAVLHTLTAATSTAHPAPGMLRGSEYLVALTRGPVTGTITVTRSGSAKAVKTVHAYDAAFWETLRPGTYFVVGHAGDAPCPPVTVTVRSGETTEAPEIDCQGE